MSDRVEWERVEIDEAQVDEELERMRKGMPTGRTLCQVLIRRAVRGAQVFAVSPPPPTSTFPRPAARQRAPISAAERAFPVPIARV